MSTINYPSISIITTSYNSDLVLFEKVLKSIKGQDYPQGKIEHIVADGGSNNGTIVLAKKYNCRVFVRKGLKDQINARMYEAMRLAKNEILAIIETDNVLPNETWLKQMIEPFNERDVFCSYNAFNCFNSGMSLLSRYCALFGVSDPVLFYLNKSEKMSWHNKQYNKGNSIKKNKNYSVVVFNHRTLPTIGDNGCLIKKEALLRTSLVQKNFIHLDLFYELLDKGYSTYGVVNNCIFHMTGSSIIGMIKRRLLYRKIFYEERKNDRKYLVFNPNAWEDWFNIFKFCLFTVTFIEPMIQSIRGYIKIRDMAWFLHPIMCWVFFIGYAKFELTKKR